MSNTLYDSNEYTFRKILSPNPLRACSQSSSPSISNPASPNIFQNDPIQQLIMLRKETMQSYEKKIDMNLNANDELEAFANELEEMNFEF